MPADNELRSREVRLGLVLYGGVSLCIYENGMVQEIYRAICNTGVYKLIGELIDSDIVVDVISGTSAGGVNGVMLAYALANKADFSKTAAKWRELGDIEQLLRTPEDKTDTSILNSKYYQDQLTSCYAKALEPLSKKDAPPLGELDLFVTGTDAYGVVSTVYDDLGHPIDVKNHRALFQLQYRGDRKNDFKRCGNEDVTAEDMATLSRLTSGFPVAFEPIRIGKQAEDPNFYRWGKLSGPAVYMDGGILNNKPFTSTIKAIASRTATREVERFLIYVEPRPEKFEQQKEAPKTPNIVQAGLWSLTSIPSYQSIAADLQAIEAHNERSLKVQKIVEGVRNAPNAGVDCMAKATVVPGADDPCSAKSYLIARLLLVKDAAVESILNSPDGQRDFMQTDAVVEKVNRKTGKKEKKVMDLRRSGRLLVQSFWQWTPDPNNKYKTLVDYDVFFRKRRVDHLTGSLMGALKDDEKPRKVPQASWEAVNHSFKLYEITEWAMRTWLTQWTDSRWEELSEKNPYLDTLQETERNVLLSAISQDIWKRAEERLDRLMTCDIPIPDFNLTSTREDLAGARKSYYDHVTEWFKAPKPGTSRNLLIRLDDSLAAAISLLETDASTAETGLLLRNEFCRFVDVDRQLLPIQVGSGFESTNVIRVVRFSPLDAKRGLSQASVEDKVRGTALANFGAFFKEGWRANDIMMGRLDAVCLLTECFLTKERLTAMTAQHGVPDPAAIVALVGASMPGASAALSDAINQYYATPCVTSWEKMIDAIVLAAHAEIVAEEWQEVAQSTLKQQYAWGQYQSEPALPTWLDFPMKAVGGKASPDELLVQIAAEAIRKRQLPPFDQSAMKKRPFLEEVPLSAMEEHASLAMVRLGKSLLASVPQGKARETLQDNLFFKISMRWLPGFFYRLVHTRRTQPDWMLVPIAAFLNLALMAVLVLAWISHWKQALPLTYTALVTAGVAAGVLAEWALTRKRGWKAVNGMVLAILLFVGSGFWFGYKDYGHLTETGQSWDIAEKCLKSALLLAVCAFPLVRSTVLRMILFLLAGVVLVEWIWK